jgi:hypothetical protein
MQLLCPCLAAHPWPCVRVCVRLHAVCFAEANGVGCMVVELVPCAPQVQSLAGVNSCSGAMYLVSKGSVMCAYHDLLCINKQLFLLEA